MDCQERTSESRLGERFVRLNPTTHQQIKNILHMVTNNRKAATMDDIVTAAFSIISPDDIVNLIKSR